VSTGVPRLQEHPCTKVGRSVLSEFSTRGLSKREILSILSYQLKKTQESNPDRILEMRFHTRAALVGPFGHPRDGACPQFRITSVP
jgi:hypothetical protein